MKFRDLFMKPTTTTLEVTMPPEGTEAASDSGQTPDSEASQTEVTTTEGQKPEAEPQTFERSYVEQLRSENAKHRREAKAANEKLEEISERDASEAEKAKKRAEKAEARANEAEVGLLRYTVATEKKVPADAVSFLTGDTREELEANADKLLKLTKAEQNPDFDGGARQTAEEAKSPEVAHNETILESLGLKPNP